MSDRDVSDRDRDRDDDQRLVVGFGVAVDASTEITWHTPAAGDLLGGRTLLQALDPTSTTKLQTAIERAHRTGAAVTSEVNLLTTEGEYRTYLLEIAPRDGGGATLIGVDVSRYVDVADTSLQEWVAAERTVDDAEARLHGQTSVLDVVLAQVPGALWALDRGGRLVHLAGSRRDAFGWEELGPGAAMEQLLGADRSTQAWRAHLGAMAGESASFEYREPGTGAVFQVQVEARTDQYGMRDGCVGLALEITEVRQAADRTREALVRERAALVELQDLEHRKRELLTAVSHEMRTPLTKLHSGALLVQRLVGEDDDRLQSVAGLMLRGSDRLKKLLDDLTDVNELDTQRRSGGAEIELHAVIGRVVEEWVTRTGRPAVQDVEPVLYPIAVEHVERLLRALLDNVADHTPDGTATWVSLRSHEGHVNLVVADDGPGIAEEDREVVLTPFAQSGEVREHAPGLGLGLSVAQRISQAYGGSVDVEERPGGGTLCRVSLPHGDGRPRPSFATADVVADALATAGSADDLGSVTRPLLEVLQLLTGLSSTYLTNIDWEGGTQQIQYALNSGTLEVPEGREIDWSDTLCRRALDSGRLHTDDVPAVWPDAPAGRDLGIQTYVSSAVVLPDGEVYGTLCGASDDRLPVDEETAQLLQVFSRVISDVIARERARQASEARALRAEQQMASRARFLAVAEHSVREPLSAIQGWVSTLQAGQVEADRVPDALNQLAGSADRLSLRIRELLDEAASQAVASEIQLEQVDLASHLGELRRELGALSPHHPVRVVVAEGLTATVDPRALRIVLEHLVENAAKYDTGGGEVTISAEATPAGRTAISVRDRGPGLPEDVDVFSPFVRGEHPGIEGTGLGLHIVSTLVHAMEGDVAAERHDPGTAFRILLRR